MSTFETIDLGKAVLCEGMQYTLEFIEPSSDEGKYVFGKIVVSYRNLKGEVIEFIVWVNPDISVDNEDDSDYLPVEMTSETSKKVLICLTKSGLVGFEHLKILGWSSEQANTFLMEHE